MPEPLLLVSAGGCIVAANAAAIATIGWREEQLLGRPLAEVVKDGTSVVPEFLRLRARQRHMVPGRLIFLTRNDGELDTPCEAGLAIKEGGQSHLLLRFRDNPAAVQSRFRILNDRIDALGREIHKRRLAEQALAEREQWLRTTLTSIGDGVIVTDSGGGVTWMNPVAEQLSKWNESEAKGRQLTDVFRILHESTRRPIENPVQKVLRTGRIVGLGNHTLLVARDGSECPIDDSAAPIMDQGRCLGIVLVFRDVTAQRASDRALRVGRRELQHRAEQLAATDRRKDEFLATLAHELRNPLAP
ncbi:MAG TPA: PAS domain-containing protein, partial [Terriglobales bacterium]|nr:PAS domain-containing protein [Terriglobales bacterium]